MKLSSFRYLVGQGFDNVWKNRVMAFASFCVLLVSLLLVGFSVLFSVNIKAIIGGIEGKNEAVIFLEDNTTPERVSEIGDTLRLMPNISTVQLYTKEQAFEDLKTDMSDKADVFASLGDDNPLPDEYRICVSDIALMNETIAAAERIPNVEYVRSPETFVEILTETRRVITIVMSGIIIAMLIVSMVIISNTTRASVFSRRREISIMQSVGATKTFIRFPFFVEGMINGFMAGVFATLVTWFMYDSLVSLLSRFSVLSTIGLGNIIPFNRIYLFVMAFYLVGGALIGAIGSVLATRVHLKYRAANM